MKILLLEFVDEAQSAIAQFGADFLNKPDVQIISLHPKVAAFLTKEGIKSVGTVSFFDNDAQHRSILKSEELTFKILNHLALQDNLGISQGYRETCLHHLRLHFNHFLWIIEILRGVSRQHNIEAIYAAIPENAERMYTPKGYIQDGERFIGCIAQEFCQKRNLPFHPIPFALPKVSIKDTLLQFLARLCGLALMGMEYGSLRLRKYKNQKVIIVPAMSYRMDFLLKEIKELHPAVKNIMIWEGQNTAKQEMYKVYLTLTNILKKFKKTELLDSIIHLDLLRDLIPKEKKTQKEFASIIERVILHIKTDWKEQFAYEGIDVSKIAAQKIEKGLKTEILKLQHSTYCLAKVLENISPKLLMSMYSAGIYFMMGELGEKQGYVALNISHGTHVPPNNEFERIENYRLAASVITNTYPYVSVQTPWTNRFLDFYKDERKRVFTGPLLFSVTNAEDRKKVRAEILGEHNSEAKIIIHASTQKGRHGMRFHITESLDEYLKTLSDIIEAVNKLENVYFILRPHPVCNLSKEEFNLLLPPCPKMRIMTKGGFSRLLSAADVLVSYSSTCIEEAIQNRIPVILYDQWNRYNHFGSSKVKNLEINLKNPAYYITQPEQLKDTIDRVLKAFSMKTQNHNDWQEYIYPKDFKNDFYRFVGDALDVKTLKEFV